MEVLQPDHMKQTLEQGTLPGIKRGQEGKNFKDMNKVLNSFTAIFGIFSNPVKKQSKKANAQIDRTSIRISKNEHY